MLLWDAAMLHLSRAITFYDRNLIKVIVGLDVYIFASVG